MADTDPVEYTKRVHADNPAVMALMAEVERGRERRADLERHLAAVTALTRDTDGSDLPPESELPVGEFQAAIAEPRASYCWCIGCQEMVPTADWQQHRPHHPLQMGNQDQ